MKKMQEQQQKKEEMATQKAAMVRAMQAQEVDMKKMQEQQQKKEEMATQKAAMVRALCDTEAHERLQRVGLVKPETCAKVEAMILQMANQGMIQEKVTEGQITQLLEKVGEASAAPSVKIVR